MPFETNEVIPVFRIFDVAKAKEFYVGYMGFSIDWEHRFDNHAPLYMQVTRGALTLHLTEHYGDCCPGATVFVRVSGLDDLHAELHSRNYRYLRPGIEAIPGIGRTMEITDPFGNRLRLTDASDTESRP